MMKNFQVNVENFHCHAIISWKAFTVFTFEYDTTEYGNAIEIVLPVPFIYYSKIVLAIQFFIQWKFRDEKILSAIHTS